MKTIIGEDLEGSNNENNYTEVPNGPSPGGPCRALWKPSHKGCPTTFVTELVSENPLNHDGYMRMKKD